MFMSGFDSIFAVGESNRQRRIWPTITPAPITARHRPRTLQLPSYTTLDLSADYTYSKTTQVGFRIRNATDELYAESAYGNTQVLIANPRTYELSLRMRF
jgi:outer membrane receptor protein involved in Fe transport